MTGATAPSPVVEELKREVGAASLQLQPIARGNLLMPGSATTTNVRYNNSCWSVSMSSSSKFILGQIQFSQKTIMPCMSAFCLCALFLQLFWMFVFCRNSKA